jgi:SAM-dependent methyltransferase
MMPTPKDILGQISGGRVLDLATGRGDFIHFLIDGLKDYTEIIGMDHNERFASAFAETFKDHSNIHFQQQDVTQLDEQDDSFDMVTISNSLHHLDPMPVLRQMKRVLRPRGFLLISEMYRDGQTETQMTHVLLHDWWGAVDSVDGVFHRATYRRSEILEMASSLGLGNEALYDICDLESDPKDPEILQELDPVFERFIQRAEGYPDLQARGRELRRRLEEIGFHSATTLLLVGQKM